MKICIIAAVARNGVIGMGGKIPWHIPEDLQRFKKLTTGHAVIMGRKTYESIGRPLPRRCNIVLTRRSDAAFPDTVISTGSLHEALEFCRSRGEKRVFVIGGGDVYAQALSVADEMYLTFVDQEAAGDTRFPEWDRTQWNEVNRRESQGVTYVDYVRVR